MSDGGIVGAVADHVFNVRLLSDSVEVFVNAIEEEANQLLRVVLIQVVEMRVEPANSSPYIVRCHGVSLVPIVISGNSPAAAVRVRLIDEKIERLGQLALAP